MKKTIFLIVNIMLAGTLWGGHVEKGSFKSSLLKKRAHYLTVIPDTYKKDRSVKRYPVLYLLHCAGCFAGLYLSPEYGAQVDRFIDSVRYIVVIPDDGSSNGSSPHSWWLDSPKKPQMKYSSFLVKELKPHIDAKYRTIKNRKNTGIAGHSMGGFGALHNCIEHPQIFGAAYSIKGGVDLLPYPDNWDLPVILGNQYSHKKEWIKVNILDNACRLAGKNTSICFYSGPNDWFVQGNRRLHEILDSCKIKHTYYETSEEHVGFPMEQMKKVMLFFNSIFTYKEK